MNNIDYNYLLEECDYPMNQTIRDSVIKQLQNLQPESAELFNQWVKTRKIDAQAFNIEGITPAYLRETRNMVDIAIILAYDGLLREPKKSAALLKMPVVKLKTTKNS